MLIEKRHFNILKALAHHGTLTHNKLFEKTGMNRVTFRKYLNDLIPTFIERQPPRSEWKKGMKVFFRLTSQGKRRLTLESVFVECQKEVTNFFKEMYERSAEALDKKPLVGATSFLTSKSAPIFGLLHIFPTLKYKSMVHLLSPDQKQVGDRIAEEIGRLLEFFIIEEPTKEQKVYADYIPFKESCFTMSFLPKKQSGTMKQAVKKNLFSRYWHIVSILNSISENAWLKIWKAFQDPRFLKGEGPLILANGFRYDPKNKKLELIPKAEVEEKLRVTYCPTASSKQT